MEFSKDGLNAGPRKLSGRLSSLGKRSRILLKLWDNSRDWVLDLISFKNFVEYFE